MIGLSRRRALTQYARSYAFDCFYTNGDIADSIWALMTKAEGAGERDHLFKHFARAYVDLGTRRLRRLSAEARTVLREATV